MSELLHSEWGSAQSCQHQFRKKCLTISRRVYRIICFLRKTGRRDWVSATKNPSFPQEPFIIGRLASLFFAFKLSATWWTLPINFLSIPILTTLLKETILFRNKWFLFCNVSYHQMYQIQDLI